MTLSNLFALLTLDFDDDELDAKDPDASKQSTDWLALMANRLEPVTSIPLTA